MISSHTLLYICLLTHARIKVNPYLKGAPMHDIGNTIYVVNSRIIVGYRGISQANLNVVNA